MPATKTYPKGCKPPKDLARRMRLSALRNPVPQFAALVLPAAYDCREKGYVTAIKDQGQCGDCWNFSGTGCAEMAAVVAGMSPAATTSWAEQSVLDCGSNGGCDGDWPETALEQAKNSGLANTSDYPYEGGPEGACKTVPHPNVIANYGYVGSQDAVPPVEAIKTAILTYGPVAIAVAADDAFQAYTSGVFQDSGSAEIDHAVMLVGWQDYDAAHPAPAGSTAAGYWVLRNSWGASWGEAGYMNIEYGANQVGYGAMWATCSAPSPSPSPVPPSPSPAPNPSPAPAPVPATTLTGTTTPATVTIQVPVGLLGNRTAPVPVPIPALAVSVQAPAAVTPGAAVSWLAVVELLLQYGAVAWPIISADLAAGKTFGEILEDLAAAVLTKTKGPKKKPCGC